MSVLKAGALLAGKYRIERTLAEGAMGQVYVACQEPIERKVAIKVLKPALAGDKELVERFLREAVAVSKLHHPNTITVLDYGETDEKILYIAMELLEGESLEELLDREGALAPERAVEIAEQVAGALTEAHHKGVLHRDLKPPNIFVSQLVGKGEHVKVLDFGIAKLLDSTETPLTRAGMVFGTPEYMAPEQSSGGELDGRTDLYALGVLMWQMLTAKLPYRGTNPIDTVMKHSTAPIPELPEHIPAGLKRFVYKCMDKDKGRRPADAEAFIAQLREAMAQSSSPGVEAAPEQAGAAAAAAAASASSSSSSSASSSSSSSAAPVAAATPGRKKKGPLLAVGGALLFIALVVGAIVMFSGTDKATDDGGEVAEAAAAKPEKKPETSLLVVSPQGKAKVFVDGEVKGTTPLTLQGKAGKRLLIILEREGFKPGKASVKFPRKGERRVEVSLEKKKRKKKIKKKEVKKKKAQDEGYDDGY